MLREAVWQAEVVLRQSVLPAEALLHPEAQEVLHPKAQEVLHPEAQEVLHPEAQDVLCQEEVLLPRA
jgi:hypothetical protein